MKKKLDDFEYTDKFLEDAIAEFNELEILENLEDNWTEEIEALYWAAQELDSDVIPEELKNKDGKS
jgi:hypothetical protein